MSGSVESPLGLPRAQFDTLSRRVRYGEWCGTNRLDRALLVRNWRIAPAELPGWSVTRRRRIAPLGRPPMVQVNLAAAGDAGKVVRAEVYEAPSLAAAHALLVGLLGGYQVLPDMQPCGGAIGDVVFELPGGRSVLFARGNLVFVVNSIGTAPVPASEIAQIMDEHLVAPPPEPRAPATPAFAPRMRSAAARAAQPPGLVAAAYGEGEEPMLKVFARGASLALDKDNEVRVTPEAGVAGTAPEVEAFLIDAAGGVDRVDPSVRPPADPAPKGEDAGLRHSGGDIAAHPAGGRRRPRPR